MFAEKFAIGREEQRRAVQRAAFALDTADHQVNAAIPAGRADHRRHRTRHVDRAFEIAAEHGPAFGSARSDAGAEIEPFGVASEERFGEHDQIGALRGRRIQPLDCLRGGPLDIEQNGSGLDGGHSHGAHIVDCIPRIAKPSPNLAVCNLWPALIGSLANKGEIGQRCLLQPVPASAGETLWPAPRRSADFSR